MVLELLDDVLISHQKALKINKSDTIMKVIDLLKKGTAVEELRNCIPNDDVVNLIEKLNAINALIESWENKYKNQHVERQLFYWEQYDDNPNMLQNKLEDCRVAIIGLGGVGGVVLQNLVAAGVKNYILVDYDKVELHNLNRQYTYNLESVGKLKTSESKGYIEQISKDSNVITFNEQILSHKDLNILNDFPIDIIVNAADQPFNISEEIYLYCKKRNIPFITGGLGIYSGSFGPLLDRYSYEKQIAFETVNDPLIKKYYSGSPVKGSIGTTNSIISSLMAHNIILYLIEKKPFAYEKQVSLNFNNLSFDIRVFEGEKNEKSTYS